MRGGGFKTSRGQSEEAIMLRRRRGGAYRAGGQQERGPCNTRREKDFFIDYLLVRIDLIIEMVSVDWPCAMGV